MARGEIYLVFNGMRETRYASRRFVWGLNCVSEGQLIISKATEWASSFNVCAGLNRFLNPTPVSSLFILFTEQCFQLWSSIIVTSLWILEYLWALALRMRSYQKWKDGKNRHDPTKRCREFQGVHNYKWRWVSKVERRYCVYDDPSEMQTGIW